MRGGILDLSDWEFDQSQPVALNGDWEFYWQQHHGPADFLKLDTQSAETIAVPGPWNDQNIDSVTLPGEGFGTYRVNILIGQRFPLALKVPDVGTAHRLYIDGQEVLTAGFPGVDSAGTTPKYKPGIIQFLPARNRIEIIFQVSNFDHRQGGLWLPITLGTAEQISRLRDNQLARDLILFGAILIIGLYNLALFSLRTENRSSLYLGLFCLLLAVRQIMVGDRFMAQLAPNLPFSWYICIEYMGWYLAVSTFVEFLRTLFPKELHRLVVRIIHGIFLLGAAVTLLTPPALFTQLVPVYQLLTVAALIYGAATLTKATLRGREGAPILLFAYAFLFYTSISDILVNASIAGNILLLDLGLFVFVLSQSILISYRFTQSFKTIEAQRTQLEATNVKLRTQEKLRREAETESEALHKRIAQSEKMEAIGLLAGGVAHDLNNILSSTVTYPELALLDLPDSSPLIRPLKMTRQAGLRAAAVIQDLLTLARRGVVQREVVSLNDAVDEYLESVEHQLLIEDKPDLEIETDLEINLDLIEGSPVHLQKLIMNLISNAIDAQNGSGHIRVATHNEHTTSRELHYMPIEAGDYVVFTVEDEGSGIESDDLDKIFEPFYTTKVMGKSGTGLGMSVIWGVVYDHNGAIDVSSYPGRGTRFDVYFPITQQKPVPREPRQSIDSLIGNGEKILVVDDIEEQRLLTCDVLSRLGYEATACATGAEAVKILKQETFDLVLLDMVIDDGLDGLGTYRAIIEEQPGIRSILVSGFAETEQVIEAQSLGAGPFLRKPFTIEAIGSRIKQELSR